MQPMETMASTYFSFCSSLYVCEALGYETEYFSLAGLYVLRTYYLN